jgi:hypothetical protein
VSAQLPVIAVLARISDRLAGSRGAVTNAASAVRRDAVVARRRRAALEAVRDAAVPAPRPATDRMLAKGG